METGLKQSKKSPQTAIFGGGCFWCTEAVFEMLKGVISVMPGYAGGKPPRDGKNVTYEEVCSGRSGHAEVIKIEYDPAQISFNDLLTVFFSTHDGTTLNRQGNDVGTQYRSVIFYATDEQKQEAERFIQELNAADPLRQSSSEASPGGKPIVTEVKPLEKFYAAEEYHRQYYKNNTFQPYCQVIIGPKIDKLRAKFNALLKEAEKK